MNHKTTVVVVTLLAILGGWYVFSRDQAVVPIASDPRNATYSIDGEPFTLVDGVAETETAPGSASKTVTRYFGNEVTLDLNDDGRDDSVFLLTQETGGSGTFYYVAAALNTEDGYVGSDTLFLGDRIAPQSTVRGQHKIVIVNYADRAPGEDFSVAPSVGNSIWLLFDPEYMQFGEVAQDFEGEADPSRMTLTMKTWKWEKITSVDHADVMPNDPDAFTLVFMDDGTFSATTDCNAMFGNYVTEEQNITFSDIAMTKKYCGEESQEQVFSSLLDEVHSYRFTSRGELIFDLKQDAGTAVFR